MGKDNLNHKKLNNEELENISGGCYSKDTYQSLGIAPIDAPQHDNYHPVIVTRLNHCSKYGRSVHCEDCNYVAKRGAFITKRYCRLRSREVDPYK